MLIACESKQPGLLLSGNLQRLFWFGVWLTLGLISVASKMTAEIQHVMIFKEPGRFGGWPANHGIWMWDDEIVVGLLLVS